ncbi:UNVERIFIED_CONTAM: hypothetical protein Slati_2143800 [Sesamum latifolium]|uniref:Uncharacterized protein n=1 Tax=Sesamum latifolium TaxID=2727402 RepID=A0AAW2WU05_9LAMI
MEIPSNTSNKQKVVGTFGNTQALQVVVDAPLAPARGSTVVGSSKSADLLTELSIDNTSSNTSSGGLPHGLLGTIQQMITSVMREQMLAAVPAPVVAPTRVDVAGKGEVPPARGPTTLRFPFSVSHLPRVPLEGAQGCLVTRH